MRAPIPLPREHGAWAMLLVPILSAMVVGGGRALHLALALGLCAGYAATSLAGDLLRGRAAREARRWRAPLLYGALACACLVLVVAKHRAALPWLALAVGYTPLVLFLTRRGQERALWAGLLGLPALTIGAPLGYLLAHGGIDARGLLVWSACLLHFAASLVFVKGQIRRRNDARYRRGAELFAAVLIAAPPALGHSWLVAVVGLPNLSRHVLLYGRKVRPLGLGLGELAGALCLVAALSVCVK